MMQTDVFKGVEPSAEPTERECCVCSLGGPQDFCPRGVGHTTVQHNRISSFIMWFQLQELQDFRGKKRPTGSPRIA